MNTSFEVGNKPTKKNLQKGSEFICDFCKSLKESHHFPCEKCYNTLFFNLPEKCNPINYTHSKKIFNNLKT
jgi:hypothetical protein